MPATAAVTSDVLLAANADASAMGGEELTTTLPVPVDLAYALFADVEGIPRWLSIVRSARVLARREDGRARRVAFMAELQRGTIGYQLDYAYEDDLRRVSWMTVGDGNIRVAGEARFSPLGEYACLMYYRLGMSLPSLGAWSDPAFEGHAASAVVHDFRDYARGAH